MAEEKPRLARLTEMVTILQSGRIVTAREIANKYNISIRTVYRDMRTLEQSGIPIITEEGKGYALMNGYKLPPVMFTQEEALAILTAEKIIDINNDQSLSDAFKNAASKIRATFNSKEKSKSQILSDRILVRKNDGQNTTSDILIKIQTCIANYTLIQIEYRSLENQHTKRLVEPFALYTTQNNWILIAYCRLRKEFRAFRLDRIQKLIVQDVPFEPHDMTLEQFLEECRKKQQHP